MKDISTELKTMLARGFKNCDDTLVPILLLLLMEENKNATDVPTNG